MERPDLMLGQGLMSVRLVQPVMENFIHWWRLMKPFALYMYLNEWQIENSAPIYGNWTEVKRKIG